MERQKELPLHLTRKKILHLDTAGHLVTPEKPNGIKLEKFIFDVFRFADPDKFVVFEAVTRSTSVGRTKVGGGVFNSPRLL